jgi:glycosyltransferase involved in cell wall biosynthesis
MDPILTIYIPCYNQPEYLRQCLESVLSQDFNDFKIIIIDDASPVSYLPVLSTFWDRRIEYTRNARNLGAMKNMLGALNLKTGSRYVMVFHEDDLMAPGLLKTSIDILESDSTISFTASEMLFFDDPKKLLFTQIVSPQFIIFDENTQLLRQILRGAVLNFGSVIYRVSALVGIDPLTEYEHYWTLCDRPFLCKIAAQRKSALIREPLVYCRSHGSGDQRSRGINFDHFLNFMKFYRSCFPQNWSGSDRLLYNRWASRVLVNSVVEDHSRFSMAILALRQGLVAPGQLFKTFASSLAYQFYVGAKRIIKSFLGDNAVNFVKSLKSHKNSFSPPP